MEKYKSLFLLGTAVIIALITSVLIYNMLQKRNQHAAAPLLTQPVAVAVADLAWGTALTKEMIRTVPYLKENFPQGSFPDSASLVGRILISPIKTDEPIFESRLAPLNIKTGGVAAVISRKKRAVAVRVDPVIGVSGFIHPGNRVDVMVTIATDRGSVPMTKIALENILVLAAGPDVDRKGKDPSPVNVITLEVTPEEAEKLALAATEGKLQLALRNFNDTEDAHTKGTTVPILLASYSGKEKKEAVKRNGPGKPVQPKVLPEKNPIPVSPVGMKEKPLEKPPMYVVKIIKGDKVSEAQFEREGKSR
ncbi:MAG: Flp pilus assembly protein CpaB [Deltaproteobacteria bacterium]|nr:Flp pilus assembly protein CpaB [Deltaproteobacteria bacterium]